MEGLKILVVDDEARMRKLVRDFLSIKGFSVVEAADGEEALDRFFEQKDIALVLLLGGLKNDPQVFPDPDPYADSPRGGERRAAGV